MTTESPPSPHPLATATATSSPSSSSPSPPPKPTPIPTPTPKPALFQRLWTDEDEIELLKGFHTYTIQRGYTNSSYHHDTTPFYDSIKSKLQLDFNKNQLVEKLRRLKKKFRNAIKRIESGKDLLFKSSHDQQAFEISKNIWSGIDDDTFSPNPVTIAVAPTAADTAVNEADAGSRKRTRKVAFEETDTVATIGNNTVASVVECGLVSSSVSNVIEETVRNCLSPVFKEMLGNMMKGGCELGSLGLGLGAGVGVGLGGVFGNANAVGEAGVVDEKWKEQQILELEVYGKRMELVQEQIQAALAELRSQETC